MTVGGLVSLPAWANRWTPESLGTVVLVSADEATLLGELVDTIIPETTTPGARSLNVHQFILRMIRDCYGPAAQTSLQQGLLLLDATARQAYGKPFANGDTAQRLAVLATLTGAADPAGKTFVDLMKRLTIQGYMNSEYYLVNVEKFNMAPGFYHGCVPVPKLAVNGSR